jgi:hypothetical protein
MANTLPHKDNASGLKGVWWDVARKKWSAQICVRGRKIHLGRFVDKEKASAAYANASIRHFGDFANA